MKKKRITMLVVGCLMCIVLKISIATWLTIHLDIIEYTNRQANMAAHAYTGFAFIGLLIIYNILNWGWFADFKKRQNLINIALILMFAIALITGIILMASSGFERGSAVGRVHGVSAIFATILIMIYFGINIVRFIKRRNQT